MGKVDYDFNDTQDYAPIPEDVYRVQITNSEYIEKSKSSGQPMFSLEATVRGGEFDGRKLKKQTVSLSQKAATNLDDFLNAIRIERTCKGCGQTFTESEKIPKVGAGCPNCHQRAGVTWNSGEPDGAAFLGKEAMVRVELRPSQQNPERKFPNIARWTAVE